MKKRITKKTEREEAELPKRAVATAISARKTTKRKGKWTGPWIKTFSWLPTFTFDGGTVWLHRVWKRHVFKHLFLNGGADWWWQYRRFPPR